MSSAALQGCPPAALAGLKACATRRRMLTLDDELSRRLALGGVDFQSGGAREVTKLRQRTLLAADQYQHQQLGGRRAGVVRTHTADDGEPSLRVRGFGHTTQ